MSSEDQSPALTELVNVNDNIMGLQEGITLVEYGDYSCPHCGYLFEIIHGLMMEYGGKIRFVFRHFPLSTIHPEARQAAAAAEAKAWVATHRGAGPQTRAASRRVAAAVAKTGPAVVRIAGDWCLCLEF